MSYDRQNVENVCVLVAAVLIVAALAGVILGGIHMATQADIERARIMCEKAER